MPLKDDVSSQLLGLMFENLNKIQQFNDNLKNEEKLLNYNNSI